MTEETASIVIPDRRAPNPYRKPFLILVTVICLSLMAQAFSSWLTWDVAHDTNTIVSDVNFRNSDENQVRQGEILNYIIARLDCNSRRAIEDALNDLSEESQQDFNIDISNDVCSKATTTTKK